MFNFNINNYMDNVAESPNDFYRGLNQATISSLWNNTTQIRKVKEENYPFDNNYEEIEAWVSTISDITTNTDKVVANYIELIFKEIEHEANYRGQKYVYKTNDVDEDTYLCYEKLNPLTQIPNTKLIMCNNKIKWINYENGAIYEEPIFVGWELTSTNNQVSGDGTVPQRRLVCLMQGNEKTRSIKENNRFMLGHTKAFKVTQIDDTDLGKTNDEYSTLLTMYIEWSSILPSDNKELNIADYYNNNYEIKINQDNFSQVHGFSGTLTATTKYNNNISDLDVVWESNQGDIVSINQNGIYELIGLVGESATIKCYVAGNPLIYDEILINIIENPTHVEELIINPNGTINLYQGSVQTIVCGLYKDGVLQSDLISCNRSWENDKNYTISSVGNTYTIKNVKKSSNPLILTFNVNSIVQTVTINLKALF